MYVQITHLHYMRPKWKYILYIVFGNRIMFSIFACSSATYILWICVWVWIWVCVCVRSNSIFCYVAERFAGLFASVSFAIWIKRNMLKYILIFDFISSLLLNASWLVFFFSLFSMHSHRLRLWWFFYTLFSRFILIFHSRYLTELLYFSCFFL